MDSVAISILLSYCIFISPFVMGVFIFFSPFFELKFIIASSKLYFFFEGFQILVYITRDAEHILILVSPWKTEFLSYGRFGRLRIIGQM